MWCVLKDVSVWWVWREDWKRDNKVKEAVAVEILVLYSKRLQVLVIVCDQALVFVAKDAAEEGNKAIW